MGLFGKHKVGDSYGAIIDIGSGSVLAAIVLSKPDYKHPQIIWSKREYLPLRPEGNSETSAKRVMTSFLNALLELETNGLKALSEYKSGARVTDTQVTVCAPWSYTVTKSITYKHKEPFVISSELIAELVRTAHKKVDEELNENEKTHKMGLTVINREQIANIANGYRFTHTNRQQAKELRVVEASAVAQEYLVKQVKDTKDKVLPRSDLHMYSFMLAYYSVLRSLDNSFREYCLIDITYEATEIGIVRDGILEYCTHTPIGSYTLARDIASACDHPVTEVFSVLQNNELDLWLEQLNEEQRVLVASVFDNYRTSLTELFKETGDGLSIPKRMYLHSNLRSEQLFDDYISEAARTATNSSHAVYPATERLLQLLYPDTVKNEIKNTTNDTALLISAQFFHIKMRSLKFADDGAAILY